MKEIYKKYFSESEIEIFQSLDTPDKIQEYVDTKIIYDPYRENRTTTEVVKDNMGDCFSGALFACACLQYNGIEPYLIGLDAEKDEDHILCVFQKNKGWGSIAQSKFLGLKGRQPIYKDIHDLAASYIEFYFNFDGSYSLDSHTELHSLKEYNFKWMYDKETVIQLDKNMMKSKHYALSIKDNYKFQISPERYWREVLFIPKEVVVPEKYLKFKPKS